MSTDGSPATRSTQNGMGIAGFVTGLLGVLLCWIPLLGVILGALGVILGGVGMSQGKRRGSSTALALTGVVLGAIGLVASIVLFVIAYNAVT